MASTELAKLSETLRTDRFIKIFIGQETPESKPFLIPQSTLEHTADYFRKAFRTEHLGTIEPGTLRFPEDDLNAWTVFLYWTTTQNLPPEEELLPSVVRSIVWKEIDCSLAGRCWALGDRYGIPAFQDVVMLELLRVFEYRLPVLNMMKVAFECTPPGSKLRELMAEELVLHLHQYNPKFENLDMFDGVVGFSSILGRKLVEAGGDARSYMRRLPGDWNSKGWQDRSVWKNYMVGDGPKKHWVYDGEPPAKEGSES